MLRRWPCPRTKILDPPLLLLQFHFILPFFMQFFSLSSFFYSPWSARELQKPQQVLFMFRDLFGLERWDVRQSLVCSFSSLRWFFSQIRLWDVNALHVNCPEKLQASAVPQLVARLLCGARHVRYPERIHPSFHPWGGTTVISLFFFSFLFRLVFFYRDWQCLWAAFVMIWITEGRRTNSWCVVLLP